MATPKICSIALIKKLDSLTYEEFYRHWADVHGPLVKPWMEKHGITGYSQVHTTPELNGSSVAPLGPETIEKPGDKGPFDGYDGVVVIEAPSWEVLLTAFDDPFYKDVIAKDEANFLDREKGVARTRGSVHKVL